MRSVGFLCQVRPGGDDYFLILTRLDSFNRLQFELYKSRYDLRSFLFSLALPSHRSLTSSLHLD